MKNNLETSDIGRQNVLNNSIAVDEIQKVMNVPALFFDGQYCFTKSMVADFYEVDERTIERYLRKFEKELNDNGYFLCKGKQLENFKQYFAGDINVAHKTRYLGLFNFRAFLNIGMLLSESEKAKQVRSLILDVVIASINKKTGGGTKYINRRDANYLPSAISESHYRNALTSSINNFVEGDTFKFQIITDCIYKAIFKENMKEYKEILQLKPNENATNTMYSEILLLIASFESGVSYEIENEYNRNGGNLLSIDEVRAIIDKFAAHPFLLPHLKDARTKMASRDFGFRDALHLNIAEYIRVLGTEEYERFLGELSVDFDTILEENKEVLKRLKQAEYD